MASSKTSDRTALLGSETPRLYTQPLRPLTRKTSRGWECIEFAEEVLGITLLPWQKWLLIHALEILPDGTFRFQVVLLLVARQNGKSTIMQIISLWRMYVDNAPLVIGTAQNLDIAEEQWQGIVDMAESIPDLAFEIDHVDKSSGKKALRLHSGSRYKVAASSRRGARGLSGDLILMDELREHQRWDSWSAVSKTTMARSQSQIWAASNAGDMTSVVLSHLRGVAHMALGDPDGIFADKDLSADELEALEDEDLGLFEWSARPDRDKWDRDGWVEANPSLGYTLKLRKIESFCRLDPEAEFRTEVLCQWVDSMTEGAFPPLVWEAAAVKNSPFLGRPKVGFDMKTGMKQSFSLVVVGRCVEGYDLVKVGTYESGQGKQWDSDHIVDEVVAELRSQGVTRLSMDGYGENGPLIPLFEQAGIEVESFSTGDTRNACMGFHSAIINGTAKHCSEGPLNVAVLGARTRASSEGWLWSRSKSITDIGPLMGAAVGWWSLTSDPDADYDPMDSVY